MANGIQGLVTPYSTSEFQAMVEAVRAHHNAAHDQYSTVAAELRLGLHKVQGARGLFGVDVRIAARRVTKPLVRCAGLETEVAKSLIRSLELYNELFLNKSPAHSRGFDINK
jgi:hypothetical protein